MRCPTASKSSSAASWNTSRKRACIPATRLVRCRRIRLSAKLQDELRRQTVAMAKSLNVVGLMNVQFAIQAETVYVLEVNPRASRTVPFVSKATGVPLAKIAARCMAGQSLAQQGVTKEVIPPYYSVKEAVFPFIKFPGVDIILGPEMKSTGEVMGVGETFAEAFVKSQLAASVKMPKSGKVFISVREEDKHGAVEVARTLKQLGLHHSGDARYGISHCGGGCGSDYSEQGGRRSSAHRGYDQERRGQPDRQHGG